MQQTMAEPLPLHLQRPHRGHEAVGLWRAGYEHAHKFEDAITGMECLPPSLAGRRYYQPTDRGTEKRIGERLEEVRKAREAARREE